MILEPEVAVRRRRLAGSTSFLGTPLVYRFWQVVIRRAEEIEYARELRGDGEVEAAPISWQRIAIRIVRTRKVIAGSHAKFGQDPEAQLRTNRATTCSARRLGQPALLDGRVKVLTQLLLRSSLEEISQCRHPWEIRA